jgi:dihydrolipoamide dehydrogenase
VSNPTIEQADLIVLGAGPGGYTAAFRAADLGRDVTLIDPRATLGGVCLNVGCIPSKALLHAAKVIDDAAGMAAHGVQFDTPRIDIPALRAWKDGVVAKLTGGLTQLARKRKVTVFQGAARFDSHNTILVESHNGTRRIAFKQAIIACGSEPIRLPTLPEDPRIIDSTGALALASVPARMLVVGGGVIGLEMAQVYRAFGAEVTVVELGGQLLPGADPDIVQPLLARLKSQGVEIRLSARLVGATARPEAISVTLDTRGEEQAVDFDMVLCAVGRRANGHQIGAEAAGIAIDSSGTISVDRSMRTAVQHIFAVGDVVGQPMLAHKATHEGKVAAEAACGHPAVFDAAVIPAVAYTDPEVAWVGMTETACKAAGRNAKVTTFPWAASGRALSMERSEGRTKLIFDAESQRLIGAAIVGAGAGELISEMVLAIEMGAEAEDIAHSIHPHPTLSETSALAAEMVLGTITDL